MAVTHTLTTFTTADLNAVKKTYIILLLFPFIFCCLFPFSYVVPMFMFPFCYVVYILCLFFADAETFANLLNQELRKRVGSLFELVAPAA